MRELLSFCESQREWLIETIETLARLESPSTDKDAVDRCGRELATRLRALGATVETERRERAGDHLRAEFPPARRGAGDRGGPPILLLGHVDTVWPAGQVERMPVRRADGRLFGPGVFDMKAGLGIGMLAARALRESGRLPCGIVMLVTTDEEVGSATSRAMIEDEAQRSRAVLVLEPSLPGGALKTSRKGCGEFDLMVRGVSAHAGIAPESGASAVHELARQIVAIEALQDAARGVSINVGLIEGGTRSNVVAEAARARVDVRVPTLSDAARIEAAFRELRPRLPGTTIEVTGGVDRPPLERGPAVARLYELARAVSLELGRELGEGSTGGGSDGNFTAALGVPTLDGLGAVGDGAHALHEQVIVADLPWRAALVAGLAIRICEG